MSRFQEPRSKPRGQEVHTVEATEDTEVGSCVASTLYCSASEFTPWLFVRSYGTKRIPIPAVIKHIRVLWQQEAELYCWSSGGAEYAKDSAVEFSIGECFAAFLPKLNILFDDQRIGEWRRLLEVHPANVTESVDDYREKLMNTQDSRNAVK